MKYEMSIDTYQEHEHFLIAELRETYNIWSFIIDGQGTHSNETEEDVTPSIIAFSKKHPEVTFTIDEQADDLIDSSRLYVCNGMYYRSHIKIHFEPFKRANLHK